MFHIAHINFSLFQSFKSVARILGVALTERPDLRLTVCQALRLVISKSFDNGKQSVDQNVIVMFCVSVKF